MNTHTTTSLTYALDQISVTDRLLEGLAIAGTYDRIVVPLDRIEAVMLEPAITTGVTVQRRTDRVRLALRSGITIELVPTDTDDPYNAAADWFDAVVAQLAPVQPGQAVVVSRFPQLRRLLIPDLDGEVEHAAGSIEAVLRHVAVWADDDPDVELPPFVGWPAADAAGDVHAAISRASFRPLYAPDGRYEHLPLAVVELPDSTIVRFGTPIDELTAARRAGNEHITTVVNDHAPTIGAGQDWLDTTASGLRGLVDHRWGDDETIIVNRITTDRGNRVVLTNSEEVAYRRIRDRLVATWHHRSAIDRWLY